MAKAKLTKRKIQGRETRKKLFDTSIALFKKHGYEKVTIDDICEKIGVSKGAFYTHFKTKDQVIVENFEYLNTNYDEALETFKTLKSALEKLYAFQRYAMQQIEELGWQTVRLVYHVETGPRKKKSFLVSKTHSLHKIMASLIQEGQQNGEIRKDQSADDIAIMLLQLYRGVILDWCLNNGSYSLVSACENLSLFAYAGIRPF